MKKAVLFFIVLFFIASGYAQEVDLQNRFSIGPRLGANLSTFNMDENTEADSRFGPLAGVFFLFSMHEMWGISADLLYSAKGADAWDRPFPGLNGVGGFVETNTRLDYLHLPVQANLFFNVGMEDFRPKIGLGPYASFLMNSSSTNLGGTAVDVNGSFASWDFGLVGSIGFNYLISPNVWLNTDLRYIHGFTDLNSEFNNDLNFANRVFSLSFGLGFNLGGMMR